MTSGVHLSAGHEERAKAARLKALPREEGSNWVRCHRRVGRLGRSRDEAQWGEGERPVKKNRWAVAGPVGRWADWAESEEKILFRIKFDF
jgi:hypothetical protein